MTERDDWDDGEWGDHRPLGYGCHLTPVGCTCNGPWYDKDGKRMFERPSSGTHGESVTEEK